MDLSLDKEFTRETTAERVSSALRDAIMHGRIAPGTQLPERLLQDLLGVSRNTIREALRILAGDGMVRHDPYRGVRVAELSEEDVHDLFRARNTLELAGVEAADSAGPEHVASVRAASKAFDDAVDAGDWGAAFEAERDLHGSLVGAIPSRRLGQFFVAVFNELRLGYFVFGGLETDLPRDRREHRAIVESLAAGDYELCRELVSDHLARSEQLLLSLMRARAGAESVEELAPVIVESMKKKGGPGC
jgi:DNA-binding GntR family transcriptional regulator